MKWKDTGDGKVANPDNSDPYYEDDGYASFKEKGQPKKRLFSGIPARYLYWGAGIAGVALLILLVVSTIREPADQARIGELEERIGRLEEALEKIDGVDEKVTRIWEQAKSFETFKTRFDRSEASMSLRMDHLAMSLDALQKKTNETTQKLADLQKKPVAEAARPSPKPVKKAAGPESHTVAAGETLYSISKRYNLTVEQLRSINQLPKGAVIHVGQKMVVRLPGN